jgi:hypothetical protein
MARDAMLHAAANLRRSNGAGYDEFLTAVDTYLRAETLRNVESAPVGDPTLVHVQGFYQRGLELLRHLRGAA